MKNTEQVYSSFLIDTGCTGPISNHEPVRRLGIPVDRQQQQVQILDSAAGDIEGAGIYYTQPQDMMIAKYKETFAWEVSPLPSDVLGYLQIFWVQ